MARRRVTFFPKIPTFLKYLLLSISLILLILLSQAQFGIAGVSVQQKQAQTLTQKGHAQLNQGQAAAALQTWQAAAQIYHKLNNQEGIIGSSINQSLALQALGLYPRACTTLIQALDLEEWVCQSSIQVQQTSDESQQILTTALQKQPELSVRVIGLRNLGDVLRLIGKPDESEIVLQQALAMAKPLSSEPDINDISLSLANTERTLYSRARNTYQTTEEPVAKKKATKVAQDKFKAALDLYQQVTVLDEKQNGTALQAQLNRLSLILELESLKAAEVGQNILELKALQSKTGPEIQPLFKQLLAAQFSELPAIQSVYARLNFANSLLLLKQNPELTQLLFKQDKEPLNVALRLAQEALQAVQGLDNKRAESHALGTIGNLYNLSEQYSLSKQYLEAALGLAQSIQAWDIAYQWQQQLGLLYQREGNLDKATKAFEAAVNSLDQVRRSILSVNPDIQFSFKEKVEPVYRKYMRLLLATSNPNIEQVIRTNEQLQLAELENFLQCGKLDLISLDKIQNQNNQPAIIHIINLGDRLEVIVQSNDRSLHRHTLNLELVKRNADNLLLNLQDERFAYTDEQVIRSYSRSLYDLLIAPIKTYLPTSGTLVFVLDNPLQGLPMALLHDGENYLLQQYSISLTLGSQLRQPQVLPPGQLKALIAGLSKKSPSFKDSNAPKNLSSLPETATEVADIKANTVSSVELLNEEFTSEGFQQKINTSNFPVIHITTHGQFSSDPEQTVILAWDRAINVRELNGLLRSKTQSEGDSLELLVLSACQTAKGDKRSALGIAGVAAQAGARSTVATLWLADAESTAQLMAEFYKHLKNGISKAEALRQAQLTLLSNPKWQHPFYWGPFILVGSWL